MQNHTLILARGFQLELNTHVFRSRGHLQVVGHAMDAFENAVYLEGDFVGVAAGNFIAVDCRFQTEALLRASQQEEAKQNESSLKNRCEIETSAHCHADRGHDKES